MRGNEEEDGGDEDWQGKRRSCGTRTERGRVLHSAYLKKTFIILHSSMIHLFFKKYSPDILKTPTVSELSLKGAKAEPHL